MAPDIYISVRYSEARDKAQLLDAALRKRGINTVMADPQSRWDRHADISGKVTKLLTAADLVIVIVTSLYGKQLRSHFGSHEEIELIEYLQKPTFVIQACEEITRHSVVSLGESGFYWGLGEPGEPPLPGGVIDLIADKLKEVRGKVIPSDDEYLRESIDENAQDRLDGRGRAAIAKAAREKEEASVRAARMTQSAKSGTFNILKICPDAMTLRGAASLIEASEQPDKSQAQTDAQAEGVAWLREAADACNYRDAKLLLAGCHYHGEDKDHDSAVKLLLEAMEGEKTEAALGKNKKKKKKQKQNQTNGFQEDEVKSEDWQGIGGEAHLECLANLGECYYHGEGVKRDRLEAARLYRKAAELGFAPAQANLAEMLSTGEGVVKDLVQAAQWFGAAATAGLMEAQFGLGHAYERGEGVEKNLATAAFWYETAASQGHSHAAGALEHLEAKMQDQRHTSCVH